MAMTLGQLAEALAENGMECTLAGDAGVEIRAVNTLEDAGAGEIGFLANPKYQKLLAATRASAVVVRPDRKAPARLNLIRTPDPYAAITALIILLHGHRTHPHWGLSPAATIADSAKLGRDPNVAPHATIGNDVVIGDNVTVYPGCYIADRCKLGDDVTLYPNVVLYEDTILGDRVAIHAGTVIAEDGLGYAPVDGKWVKIPQIGHVEIGHDVEIGANCSIDRATLGKTVIGAGTKFSNLIAVGHGTRIGDNCLFVAQVGLAGSVNVGNHVTLAGQVGVAGHLTIADNAEIAAKSGVVNDVEAGAQMLGQPAMPINDAKRVYATFTHLPEMRQRLKELETEVQRLREQLPPADAKTEGRGGTAPPASGRRRSGGR